MPKVPSMRKVTLRLNAGQDERLARLSRLEGRSRSAIVRDAIAAYEPASLVGRDFAPAAALHESTKRLEASAADSDA